MALTKGDLLHTWQNPDTMVATTLNICRTSFKPSVRFLSTCYKNNTETQSFLPQKEGMLQELKISCPNEQTFA